MIAELNLSTETVSGLEEIAKQTKIDTWFNVISNDNETYSFCDIDGGVEKFIEEDDVESFLNDFLDGISEYSDTDYVFHLSEEEKEGVIELFKSYNFDTEWLDMEISNKFVDITLAGEEFGSRSMFQQIEEERYNDEDVIYEDGYLER